MLVIGAEGMVGGAVPEQIPPRSRATAGRYDSWMGTLTEGFDGTTTCARWRRTKCGVCGKPISELEGAHAAWREDRDSDVFDPMVLHAGCIQQVLEGNLPPTALSVEAFRRAPMHAVMLFARRRRSPDGREDSVDTECWLRWVSIVLGLPANDKNCTLAELVTRNQIGELIPDRV